MQSIRGEQMRAMVSYAIRQLEIPEIVLVENAAMGILRAIDLSKRHSFAIFCGPGENGAIGLALARQLKGADKKVCVYLVGEATQTPEPWRANLRSLRHMIREIHPLETLGDLEDMLLQLQAYNTVIDAIYGVELDHPLQGIVPIVIDNLNQSRIPILSVDLPSGLDATSGQSYGAWIEANETIALEFVKQGLLQNPYAMGSVRIVSAGLPQQAKEHVL